MAGAEIGETLRQIGRLFAGGAVAGLGDAALLGRFVAGRDEEAFAALVARHGPMVLAVCRGTLRDPADAEDAFQATFLALVRQARSVRTEESLGGWLYRVARRIAARANFESARRRVREQADAKTSATMEGPSADRAFPELHDEIDRLPASYRRSVVLCYLEGRTHAEAARELRCGEATVRRRLAGARERLRARLERRGVTSASALAALELARPVAVPAAWVEATVAAAAGRAVTESAARLASAAVATLTQARWTRVAAILIVGLGVTAAGVGASQRDDPPAAKPEVKDAPQAKDGPRLHWVHLVSDVRGETWANLDDGREFRKAADEVSFLESTKHELFTYKGKGPIALTKARTYLDMRDRFGRPVPPAAFDVVEDFPADAPKAAPELERKTAHVFMDYEIETIDGHRLGRIDQYVRDALGEARVEMQIWVDLDARRTIRRRRRLGIAEQHKVHREFETTFFDYPATGPADLAALGVPKDTPVVDVEKNKRSWQWADQAPEVRRVITGQADAIRRFPRDFRGVTEEFAGRLLLEYWSAREDYIDLWCGSKTGDARFALDDIQPRHFRADEQEHIDRPRDLAGEILGAWGDLPADRIAAWFPFKRSVNIRLIDGKRTYNLTRFFVAADQPRRTELHILGGGFDELPEPMNLQWPVINWNRREMSAAPPGPDTARGHLVIKTDSDDWHNLFECDPARDFIADRQVEWEKRKDRWNVVETRAVRWKRLPNGSWYVAAWRRRQSKEGVAAPGTLPKEWNDPDIQRTEITPLPPDGFPKDIFDGPLFLEHARQGGAIIEVDQ
jgi:RNA polymerase sigma factor (sigma-70 family)